MKKIVLFLYLLLTTFAFSSHSIDSLRQVIKTSRNDTAILDALHFMGVAYFYSSPDSAIYYLDQAEKVAERIGGTYGGLAKAKTLRIKGWLYLLLSDFNTSFFFYDSASKIAKKYFDTHDKTMALKAKEIYANCINHIGSIYELQGNYSQALEYYFKALKIYDQIGQDEGKAPILGNIGNVYQQQRNYTKALEYYFKSLELFQKSGNKRGQAVAFSNIAPLYHEQKDYDKALEYYLRASEIFDEIGEMRGQASNLGNIGSLYLDKGEYQKALNYYFRALKTSKKIGLEQSEAINLGNIGACYLKIGKYKKAEVYLKKSERLLKEMGALYYLRDILLSLSELYEKTANYQLALHYHKEYAKVRDSLLNEENRKALQTMELKYQYEKEKIQREAEYQKQLAIKEKEITIQKKEKEKQETLTYAIAGGLVLVLIFSSILYHRLQITRKQKRIIEQQKAVLESQKAELESQKQMIEEKNKDIVESLTYAARLQRALLPPRDKIKELLPESFLLYMPKDIVSGDFYYVEEVGNYVFLAVGDCTGHGVPAAMMTVVCSTALMRAIKEEGLLNTDEILNRVKEVVLERVSLHDKHLLEGMDISLIRIDKNRRGEIQFSGVNHVAVLTGTEKVQEFKTDRSPYGLYRPDPYTRNIIQAEEGDTLFLFSDGFPTQFGGPKKRPLSQKRFIKLLNKISILAPDEQEKKLEEAFFKWKGELEQIDDVCVAGIKI